ncbi:MAG: hypothetical protein VKN56_05415 [Cyanobacteriota bacterium]|nr:hypothetical protein [Cyanobacteriota bacterium]
MTDSMSDAKIQLELSVADVNLILEALGEQPFKSVFGLVGRLQSQARSQLQSSPVEAGEQSDTGEAP